MLSDHTGSLCSVSTMVASSRMDSHQAPSHPAMFGTRGLSGLSSAGERPRGRRTCAVQPVSVAHRPWPRAANGHAMSSTTVSLSQGMSRWPQGLLTQLHIPFVVWSLRMPPGFIELTKGNTPSKRHSTVCLPAIVLPLGLKPTVQSRKMQVNNIYASPIDA